MPDNRDDEWDDERLDRFMAENAEVLAMYEAADAELDRRMRRLCWPVSRIQPGEARYQ